VTGRAARALNGHFRFASRRTCQEAVTVPITAPPAWCLCGHADDQHRATGHCRASDGEQPCGCREFEQDEE
jgi:hypothetical protein